MSLYGVQNILNEALSTTFNAPSDSSAMEYAVNWIGVDEENKYRLVKLNPESIDILKTYVTKCKSCDKVYTEEEFYELPLLNIVEHRKCSCGDICKLSINKESRR